MTQQLENGWPGLTVQAVRICEELGVNGLFDTSVSKSQFKILVRKMCKLKNEEQLKVQISTYKKMAALRDEIQKGNDYFYSESLNSARILFRYRVELFEAKSNFKNKYQRDNMLCDSCESEICDNTHVLFCPSYSQLREGKCLNNNQHLAEYLQKSFGNTNQAKVEQMKRQYLKGPNNQVQRTTQCKFTSGQLCVHIWMKSWE